MKSPVILACAFLASVVPASSFGWGFQAHRRLTSQLQEPLPESSCLRKWLWKNQNYAFQDQSCDPDRWKYQNHANYDFAEGWRHYLNIDWAEPAKSYPRDWAQAVTSFGEYRANNN